MATKILKGKFLPQYRTAAQWSAANPVLLAGEIGIESDTRKFKFGDGATAWNSLGYAGSGGDSAERLSGALEITDFADFPDTTVFEKPGDIVPIRVDVGDNSPNESSGLFVGTAQAWERWVSGGAENQIVYSVIDTQSGKAYSGRTTGAGGSIQWVESGGGVNGLLGSVKSLTTSFWNLISSNVSDIQAFVIRENSPEVPAEYKGVGFGFAKYYRDDVGMASVTMKLNSGSVKTFNVTFYGDGSDAYWEETGGSSGSSLPFDGPIPGYELVYSDTGAVLQLASGTGVTINFDKAIPAAQMFTSKARFMIEADIVSVSGNTLSNVARVPIAIFKPTAAGQPVFEYMIQSIATGTNIGRVRLIITSWIRESGSTGDITGCNLMAQVNNLNPSMNYALTFPGMYVKSSGGDSSR
ncbi:hyaluronate lyase N-terminal domain-containing protein [Alistipes senegalensis]|uniref:hyaluronate lyase N-terminal domain-containing protein n=1 Tax=Alistipes senegalensis TaxID=1288121 RepID=UPI0002FC617B|nr:hypothetical protein [Alistipes senegalensis]